MHEKFFGRTYTASMTRGKLEQGLFTARNINEDMYINLKEENNDIYLIVDILIVRKIEGAADSIQYYSGGYFLVELFPGDRKTKTIVTYVKDTPRSLMVKGKFRDVYKSGRVADHVQCTINEFIKQRDIESKIILSVNDF